MGVEPTKNRLTALSGFEGQPPHRERFPSVVDNSPERGRCHLSAAAPRGTELLELLRHRAAQVAAADGDAVAVEELQDQDRHLAAVVELVAELGGGEVVGRSAWAMAIISATTGRRKNWSGATSTTRPTLASRCSSLRISGSGTE